MKHNSLEKQYYSSKFLRQHRRYFISLNEHKLSAAFYMPGNYGSKKPQIGRYKNCKQTKYHHREIHHFKYHKTHSPYERRARLNSPMKEFQICLEVPTEGSWKPSLLQQRKMGESVSSSQYTYMIFIYFQPLFTTWKLYLGPT